MRQHKLTKISTTTKKCKRSKRIAFRKNVRYGPTKPPQHTSFIINFSDTGAYIKTNRPFAPGTKLFLLISTDEGPYRAEGRVVWAKKAPPHIIRHIKSGMGIRFTSVEQGLLELYRKRI